MTTQAEIEKVILNDLPVLFEQFDLPDPTEDGYVLFARTLALAVAAIPGLMIAVHSGGIYTCPLCEDEL